VAALELLSQPIWQSLAWTLLHFVWQGAAIGLGLFAALTFCRSASSRYFTALAALLLIALCPLGTMCTLQIADRASASLASDTTYIDSNTASSAALPASLFAIAQPFVVLTWMTGVMVLGARLLMSYFGVRRLRASAEPLSAQLEPVFARLARQLQVGPHVRARASQVVREALVVGLFRPLILIPTAWLTEMPPQTLEAVLAHELAHIRRHDLWVNLLQRMVEMLLFYHPVVWYVSRVLRVEREKCCDELAVAATGQPLAYVEALELVAHRRLAASPSAWATAMGGARTMNLLERVRNVLGQRPQTPAVRYWPVGLAALVLPVGLWCAACALPLAAYADDDKPAATAEGDKERREGAPRREGEPRERRPDAPPRREGDPRREGPPRGEPWREGQIRREGGDRPAPREGERREGDRPGDRPGPRDGERRPGDRPGPRDSERRPGDRPGSRDGERPLPPPRAGDRPGPRDGERPGPRPVEQELLQMIRELRAEAQSLRREVHELRESHGRNPADERPRIERD
jgi:beta-lactamase regulating signal transducer with metallopeptidase domain